MARNAYIHTAASPRHDVVVPGAIRRSFEASIAAAKKHAERTGEDLVDLLDRMDAADPRTATATHLVLSGDHARLGLDRIRARLVLNPVSGLLSTHDAPHRSSSLIA